MQTMKLLAGAVLALAVAGLGAAPAEAQSTTLAAKKAAAKPGTTKAKRISTPRATRVYYTPRVRNVG